MKSNRRAQFPQKNPDEIKINPQIACYSSSAYNVNKFKSKALAWFVQFAIRADMEEAWRQVPNFENPTIQCRGDIEIHEKAHELRELIRRKHIVDEADLGSIGLSFYSFPTLHAFLSKGPSYAIWSEARS